MKNKSLKIKYLINQLKSEETVVFLFHSVNLERKIDDDWGYYIGDFEEICKFVSNDTNIKNDTILNFIIKNS